LKSTPSLSCPCKLRSGTRSSNRFSAVTATMQVQSTVATAEAQSRDMTSSMANSMWHATNIASLSIWHTHLTAEPKTIRSQNWHFPQEGHQENATQKIHHDIKVHAPGSPHSALLKNKNKVCCRGATLHAPQATRNGEKDAGRATTAWCSHFRNHSQLRYENAPEKLSANLQHVHDCILFHYWRYCTAATLFWPIMAAEKYTTCRIAI